MRILHPWFIPLVLIGAITVAHATPVPVKKSGVCPFGYYSAGAYCVPMDRPGVREAIRKSGDSCPFGWYSSGAYCVRAR